VAAVKRRRQIDTPFGAVKDDRLSNGFQSAKIRMLSACPARRSTHTSARGIPLAEGGCDFIAH
jgi:hypothetical protein